MIIVKEMLRNTIQLKKLSTTYLQLIGDGQLHNLIQDIVERTNHLPSLKLQPRETEKLT